MSDASIEKQLQSMTMPDIARIIDPISIQISPHLRELIDGFESQISISDILDLYQGKCGMEKVEGFLNFYMALLQKVKLFEYTVA